MNAQQIQTLIEASLPDARVQVDGAEGKFEATVISAAFVDMSSVKRHQIVYRSVASQIADGSLHALSIRPLTPEEAAES